MTFSGPIRVRAVVYNNSDHSTPGERGFSGA
jgi:hypothetical protein